MFRLDSGEVDRARIGFHLIPEPIAAAIAVTALCPPTACARLAHRAIREEEVS